MTHLRLISGEKGEAITDFVKWQVDDVFGQVLLLLLHLLQRVGPCGRQVEPTVP